jgi:hypothetical protein
MNTPLRRALRIVLGTSLVALLMLSAAIAALLVWGLPELIGLVSIDGQVLTLGVEPNAGHWLIVTAAVLVALLVAAVAIPASIVLALIATAVSVIVAVSPLLLVAVLGVWLWRRSATVPAATISSATTPR